MGNTKSLYKMIVDEIEEGIRDRKYKPGDRIPTENELAQKFGVSMITVTRATQELELKGYIYRNKRKGSFICDSLDPLSMGKAAIASPSRGNLFLPLVMPFKEQIGYDILHGVEEEVKKYHHFVSVHNTGYDEFEERNIVETLIKNDVKGMIVYPCSSQKNISLFSGLLIKKMPFVLIDRAIEGIEAPLVTSNNHKGFMDLISYLFSLGHIKIGFVSTCM